MDPVPVEPVVPTVLAPLPVVDAGVLVESTAVVFADLNLQSAARGAGAQYY